MDKLLRTKFFIPHPRKNLVFRSRLVDRLNAGLDDKLTLLTAPAGFGKTTLLSEWIPKCPRFVTWLFLDEGALTEGPDLVRWTGESMAPKKSYTTLAFLRLIQGDRPAKLETMKILEETWPEGALYAQALRHRLLLHHWHDDPDVKKDAQTWLAQSRIEFAELAVIDSVYPVSTTNFESILNAAHVLAHPAKGKPGTYPLEGVHTYLKRQQDFAIPHGFRVQGVAPTWILFMAISAGVDRFVIEKELPAPRSEPETDAAQYKIEILGPLSE